MLSSDVVLSIKARLATWVPAIDILNINRWMMDLNLHKQARQWQDKDRSAHLSETKQFTGLWFY